MSLTETYLELRDALTPLGIDVGRDVLALWRDRERYGREPLPAAALKRLAELAAQLTSGPP